MYFDDCAVTQSSVPLYSIIPCIMHNFQKACYAFPVPYFFSDMHVVHGLFICPVHTLLCSYRNVYRMFASPKCYFSSVAGGLRDMCGPLKPPRFPGWPGLVPTGRSCQTLSICPNRKYDPLSQRVGDVTVDPANVQRSLRTSRAMPRASREKSCGASHNTAVLQELLQPNDSVGMAARSQNWAGGPRMM